MRRENISSRRWQFLQTLLITAHHTCALAACEKTHILFHSGHTCILFHSTCTRPLSHDFILCSTLVFHPQNIAQNGFSILQWIKHYSALQWIQSGSHTTSVDLCRVDPTLQPAWIQGFLPFDIFPSRLDMTPVHRVSNGSFYCNPPPHTRVWN